MLPEKLPSIRMNSRAQSRGAMESSKAIRFPRWSAVGLQASVSALILVLVSLAIARDVHRFAKPELVVWIVLLMFIELLPVPAWRGITLSLSFPVRLALGIIYAPPVAAFAALLGSFSPHEIHRDRSFLANLFDRSQIAISVFAGSSIFHAITSIRGAWFLVVPAVAMAAVADYLVNVSLVSAYVSLTTGVRLGEVLAKLRLGGVREFALSYLGLSLVGVVIALLYLKVEIWAFVVFIV